MEISWIVTSILAIIVIFFLYSLTERKYDYWEKHGVPYIKSPPLVGAMTDVVLMRKGLVQMMLETYEKFKGKKFGGYFQFTTPGIVIVDPELINRVLIKDFTHFEDRGPPFEVKDLFSLNLSNLTGNEWRWIRHKLTPTFTSGKLKLMFGTIKECGDHVASYLENKTGQDTDARQLMQKYILNVVGRVAFGIKLDTFDEEDEKSVGFLKACSAFFVPSRLMLLKFVVNLSFPKIRDFLKLKMIDGKVEEFFRNLTSDLIKCRQLENNKRHDFLQLMLDLKKKEKENLGYDVGTCDDRPSDEFTESEDKELMEQLKNTPLGTRDSSESGKKKIVYNQYQFLF